MPWYTKASMPTARYYLGAFAINGIGYAVGGYATGGVTGANQAYDPSTDSWSTKANMPTGRYALAAFVIDGIGYAVGGATSSALTALNHAYNPSTDTWSTKQGMPTARYFLTSFTISNIGYAVGGHNGSAKVATNQAYNPSTDTWSTKQSMPTARDSLTAFAISGIGYAVGGHDGSNIVAINQAYNPSTDTWSTKQSMPTARYHLASLVANAAGYVVGGVGSGNFAINEAYNPSTDTWSTKQSMPTARYALAAFAISGIGYAVGGYSNQGYTAVNEAFQDSNPVSASASFAGRSLVSMRAGRLTSAVAIARGRAVVSARGAGPVPVSVTFSGTTRCSTRGARATAGQAHASGRSQVFARGSRGTTGQITARGRSRLMASPLRARFSGARLAGSSIVLITAAPPLLPLGPLRLDVVTASGIVSVAPVLACTIEWTLNDIGGWSARLPVTAANADRIDAGMEVRIVREGEGEIARGRVASRRTVLENDALVIELEGYSTARELTWRTTELNWRLSAQNVLTATTQLLADTGWTADIPGDIAGQLVSSEFHGVTRFEAVKSLAQQVYCHILPLADQRKLVFLRGGRPTGFRLVLPPGPIWDAASDTLVITKLRVSRRDQDVVTQVIPVGAGEGPNQLTLRWSNRTSPYPILTKAGPDGSTIYYIRDDSAVAQYGVRERVVAFKDVAPLANSATELERAANVLYDLAAAWLQQRAQPRVEWAVEVSGPLRLRDPRSGNWLLRPGDTVRLVARGVIEDWDGAHTIVDLNMTAFVRGIERRFDRDVEQVRLDLTDTARVVRDDDLLADVVNRVWALAVAQKTVPVREIHGPFRQTIDSGKSVTMIVDWDENVRFLHQAKLVLVCRRIRSNATTAASGGGATVTSQSGGGQTVTSAGGSGTTNATATGGSHVHTVGQTQNNTTWTDPGYREQLVFANSSAGTGYGVYVGRDNTSPTNAEVYMTQSGDHTHDVTLVLSNHSHSVSLPSHSHNVSLPSHTHGLVYGIFEGSYPTAKAIRVLINGTDVTSALGGPWDPAENTPLVLDITEWLQEPDGRPKQQRNRVEIQASALFDVEIVVKSLVAIATVIPV
jgi:hypothetical protein